MEDQSTPQSSLILYQTEDGRTRIQCRFEAETLWLTQAQMAELFQVTPQNVTLHLKAIFAEGELVEEATCKDYLQVRFEGGREVSRKLRHYSLEAILAVGYRVRSHRGTQFRQWATARLTEYLVKGFTMDDERLKNPPGKGQKDYFDELLERIRDIRSSERRFYQKILDIYATSVDYSPDAEASQRFFATVQNKMHWATHGHTVAEVIAERADASKPFMGLQTTRPGGIVRKDDVGIAKNYLTESELQVLNRIVNLYIEYAELQALERKPMTMRDWIAKLDEFLKASGRPLLEHAGAVSAEDARQKAEREYEHYRKLLDTQPQRIDADFEKAAQELKKLPRPRKARETKRRPESES
ncbi:MAG: virulence RhuM family protein [Verrucomicrobiaceae bacterium]|nr:virulence RhuM family protein [Verrucomicrobiaceae bacterium]